MRIIYDPDLNKNINKIDLDNYDDNTILEAFVFLNLPESSVTKLKKVFEPLSTLIKWCQAIVSYHMIIHPFTIRNQQCKIYYKIS